MGKMTVEKEETLNDLEYILKDIGGTFGKFQIFNMLLIAFPIFLADIFVLDYVFTTLDLDYRCRIAECETGSTVDYNPNWLENAVPFEKSKPMRCMRYEPISAHPEFGSCDATSFNQSSVVECSSGEFIYRTDEVSIVNEFNITCGDAAWKLSLLGVTNNVARFIFMPVFGNLSDRFGRVPILIICSLGAGIFKFISSFSASYEMLLGLTVFDAGFSAAIYPTAFVLGMEWATTKRRILVSSVVISLYPFGEVFAAFVASQTHNFKYTLRIIGFPALLMIPYIWLSRESLRWLLVKKKYDRAVATVNHASKMNKIAPSQRTFDIIATKCSSVGDEVMDNSSGHIAQLKIVITSSTLLVRFVICIVGWIACVFLQYGTSVISVSLPGDKYWNFSFVSLSTIPAVFSTYFMLTYMKRRWTFCASMLMSGITIIASNYAANIPALSLILFFVGRFFIRHSLLVIYVYTGEMWPTSLRQTILGVCSMFGRIGSILAPMIPLMAQYSESLPFFLFFGISIVSGLLFLLMPETFETKLPDTIEEAKAIGTNKCDQ